MYFSRVRIRSVLQMASGLQHLIRGNGYGAHQLLWDLFPDESSRGYLFREEIDGEQTSGATQLRGAPIFYMVSSAKPAAQNALFVVESKPYQPRLRQGDCLAFKLRANPVVAKKRAGRKNSARHDVVMNAQREMLVKAARLLNVSTEGKKAALKNSILLAWKQSPNPNINTLCLEAVGKNNGSSDMSKRVETRPGQLLELALKSCGDAALEHWLVKKGERNGFRLARDVKRDRLRIQAAAYCWQAISKKGRKAGFSSVDFDGILEVTNPEDFSTALFNGIGPAKAFGCGLMMVRRVPPHYRHLR